MYSHQKFHMASTFYTICVFRIHFLLVCIYCNYFKHVMYTFQMSHTFKDFYQHNNKGLKGTRNFSVNAIVRCTGIPTVIFRCCRARNMTTPTIKCPFKYSYD